jgi:predicted metalloprotease with PDZ domain
MRGWVSSGAVVLVLLMVGGPAQAQSDRPGWIGISYEARAGRDGATRVVITDVRRGSPAEAAGIRPGDRLVSIEDLESTDALMNVSRRLDLRAGQVVDMTVQREGRELDLRLRAAERPGEIYSDAAISRSFRTDSMVESMFRAMDSLRVRIIESNVETDRDAERVVRRVVQTSPATRARLVSIDEPDAVIAPFEFFVFRGEQHDSLVREMDLINARMEQLREREQARRADLTRAGQRAQSLDRELEELRRQSADLRTSMAEAARASAGWEYLLPPTPEPAAAPAAPSAETFRPLTPYLLGSNRVAGAQVIDVQPELGAYFGVERGVLVVEVSPGTPAAIAGMRPGDVITRLDRFSVTTVDELRSGVAQAGDTLPVTLVRQGSSLQVLLRRR